LLNIFAECGEFEFDHRFHSFFFQEARAPTLNLSFTPGALYPGAAWRHDLKSCPFKANSAVNSLPGSLSPR
jgi:hypothetical protein